MKRSGYSQVLSTAASLLLLATIGCDRNEVKVYQVETPEATSQQAAAGANPMAMPATMPGDIPTMDKSSLPPLKYTTPDGWKAKPPTQMRVASFEILEDGKQVDVSVIPLGGNAGGDAPNVNRWRGQVGLPPLEESELVKLAEKVEISGQAADLYDVTGTAPGSGDSERIIGAILHREDTAWFFKLTGEATLAAKNKAAFIAFLKSVEFGGLAAPSTMDLSQLPAAHPPVGGVSASEATATVTDAGNKPVWNVPAGWQEGPLAQFLIAKFIINGSGDQKAEVNVSSLANDGGGLLPNINRWRGQLGLAPATEVDTTSLNVADGKASVVEFSGTNARTGKPAQLIGIIVPTGSETWFYKMMGDAGVVNAQKTAFTQFVQSAKYSHAH